jgi:hypothetical protein
MDELYRGLIGLMDSQEKTVLRNSARMQKQMDGILRLVVQKRISCVNQFLLTFIANLLNLSVHHGYMEIFNIKNMSSAKDTTQS